MNIAKPLMITRTQLSVNSTLIVTKYGSVTILARFSADFRTLENPPKLAKTRKKLETASKSKKILDKILEIDNKSLPKK